VHYTHPDSPALEILSNFLDSKRMNPEIREKGGAYGGNSKYNPMEGVLSFVSYRDSTCERSLGIMRDAGRWTLEQKIDMETLDQMKLKTFKLADRPISVRDQGMTEFLNGISDEVAQT
jgi:presequence protease